MQCWRGFLLVLVACGAGCGSIVVEEDDGDPRPFDPGSHPSCTFAAADLARVEATRSATLFGSTLHLEGVIGGREGYAVIDLSVAPARILGWRDDLAGGAAWTHEIDGYYARIRGRAIEVLDAADPARSALVSSADLAFELTEGFDAVASDGNALFSCLGSEGDGAGFLSRLDLSDPRHPGEPTALEDYPCGLFGDRGSAEGSLWVTWAASGSVQLYDLTGEVGINSHGFATDGVHHYGGITAVKTDGTVAVAELVNDAYTFLYYPPPTQFVVYTSFGAGPKRLLEVVDGQALVAVPSGVGGVAVVAFDVRTPPAQEEAVARTGMEVALEGAETSLERYAALAHDDDRVLVWDGAQLFDVALGGTGTAVPMVVLREGATCE